MPPERLSRLFGNNGVAYSLTIDRSAIRERETRDELAESLVTLGE